MFTFQHKQTKVFQRVSKRLNVGQSVQKNFHTLNGRFLTIIVQKKERRTHTRLKPTVFKPRLSPHPPTPLLCTCSQTQTHACTLARSVRQVRSYLHNEANQVSKGTTLCTGGQTRAAHMAGEEISEPCSRLCRSVHPRTDSATQR